MSEVEPRRRAIGGLCLFSVARQLSCFSIKGRRRGEDSGDVDKTGLTEVISIVRRFLGVLKYLYCPKRYESNRLIGKIDED